jgi:hypothetical protein
MAALASICTGCTSTVTHYDENGKITKIEEVTNFSRAMDGTNQKSQIVMVDGTYIDFEASATAGEGCTPGVKTKFANGKIGFINAKDSANFNGADGVVEKFFADTLEVGASGIKSK